MSVMGMRVQPAHADPASPSDPDGPVLEMRGITKRWPNVQDPVLHDVDLTVGRGQAVGLVGRNGAGKTTLLRVAAGLLEPDAGTVRVVGRDPERERTECQRLIGICSAGN